jgi:multicomponent Na+:H+ antiporter subunit D
VAVFTRPLAAVDDIWTLVYRRVGLAALMGSARGAGVFDRRVIDTVVDGNAAAARSLSRLLRRIQTGRLQDYLAWMTVAAMLVFAVVWWLADWV